MRRTLLAVGVLAMVAAVGAMPAEQKAAVPQDPELLRIAGRALAWYPDSVFRITADDHRQTPSGSFRLVTIDRECASQPLTGSYSMVIDEVADVIWFGTLAQLPTREAGIAPTAIGRFLGEFLPDAMMANMRLKVTVQWGSGPYRSGALIPFWLQVDSGYGNYRTQAAVTSDGEYLVLGSAFPRGLDPVEFRRQLLAGNELVVWDVAGGDTTRVEIVEFSDLECPACRNRWPVVKEVIEKQHGTVRHGMVSYPLTTIHPWAFRSASASWCVAAQDPRSLVAFKELFYSLQAEMEVALVTPTAIDFVEGNGLDEGRFRSCYLRDASLNAVHGQLSLGQQLGVFATPTYFVNGWQVQAPDPSWFPEMVARLVSGDTLS